MYEAGKIELILILRKLCKIMLSQLYVLVSANMCPLINSAILIYVTYKLPLIDGEG